MLFNSFSKNVRDQVGLAQAAKGGGEELSDLGLREVDGIFAGRSSSTEPTSEFPEGFRTLVQIARLFPLLILRLGHQSRLVVATPGTPQVAVNREAFPVGNGELRAPLAERLPTGVRAELDVVRVPALESVPGPRERDDLLLPEVKLPVPVLRRNPGWVDAVLLTLGKEILNALEHIQGAEGAPGDARAVVLLLVLFIARVALRIEVVHPISRRGNVLSVLAETDPDGIPVPVFVKTRNLGSTSPEFGRHDPLRRDEQVISALLDSLETSLGSTSAANHTPVPADLTPNTPFGKRHGVLRVEGSRPGRLQTRGLHAVLCTVGFGGFRIVVLGSELVLDRLKIRLEFTVGHFSRPKLESVAQHRSNALHLGFGELRLLTLIALPADPSSFFVSEAFRYVIGHGEHEPALLVVPVRSREFETMLQKPVGRSGTVKGDPVPLPVL